MASLFTWENWPVLVVCAGMIAAAIIDWWKFKGVPNNLTFPLILSGWLLGLLNMFHLVPYGGDGWVGDALGGTFLACSLAHHCTPSAVWARAMSRCPWASVPGLARSTAFP